ncbi:MAG: hypothetical protein QXV17_13050, partial [Candidatus Micrarchaeaceae archaeon]
MVLQRPIINTDRIIGVYAKPRYGKTNLIANLLKVICKEWYVLYLDLNYERPKYQGLSFNKHLAFVNPPEEHATDLEALTKFIREARAAATNFFIYVEDLDAYFDKATS